VGLTEKINRPRIETILHIARTCESFNSIVLVYRERGASSNIPSRGAHILNGILPYHGAIARCRPSTAGRECNSCPRLLRHKCPWLDLALCRDFGHHSHTSRILIFLLLFSARAGVFKYARPTRDNIVDGQHAVGKQSASA